MLSLSVDAPVCSSAILKYNIPFQIGSIRLNGFRNESVGYPVGMDKSDLVFNDDLVEALLCEPFSDLIRECQPVLLIIENYLFQ